jgi:hypothetical protein
MKKSRNAAAAADTVDDCLTARIVELGYHDFRAFAAAQHAPMPDAPPVTIATLPCTWRCVLPDASPAPRRVDLRRCSVGKDPLDLIDADAVELGDLLWRHPIIGQGAHPTKLRGRDFLRHTPLSPRPWSRTSLRRRRVCPCGGHRDDRRNSENARLARRLDVGRRDTICPRCVRARRRLFRPEQVFRLLPRPIDPFAIVTSVESFPFGLQELPQRKSLTLNIIGDRDGARHIKSG